MTEQAGLVKEFVDFQTGQLKADADPYNFSGAVGSAATLQTTLTPPFGEYYLRITQSQTDAFFRGPLFTFTAATKCLTVAYLRADSTGFPPTNEVTNFLTMLDESDGIYWKIILNTSGDLRLEDNAGTGLNTWGYFLADTWYRVEVLWEPGNTSSPWEWWITPISTYISISRGSGSGADFATTAGTQIGMYFGGQGGTIPITPLTVYHAGCYIVDSVNDLYDRVGGWKRYKDGNWQVFGIDVGKILKASATPDCDEDGNTPGDDLDTGSPLTEWAEAGDNDLASYCQYTRTAGMGAKGGGVVIDGYPVNTPMNMVYATKWLWYGVSNNLLDFCAVYGRYQDSIYFVTNVQADSFSGSGPPNLRWFRVIVDQRAATAYHVNWNCEAVMGMASKGSVAKTTRQCQFYEGWLLTLHEVPEIDSRPSRGQFVNTWRDSIGGPMKRSRIL